MENFIYKIGTIKSKKVFSQLGSYVYALCEIKDDSSKEVFYIGKGSGQRVLNTLIPKGNKEKFNKISYLQKRNRLVIDILSYNLSPEEALKIESACIDLIGLNRITNIVKGHHAQRISLNELVSKVINEEKEIDKKHSGLAFVINYFKQEFSPIELYEYTRGFWYNPPTDQNIKYAYATNNRIIKEVYEISHWVKAGTQPNFVRKIEGKSLSKKKEFIGKIADEDIRRLYVGEIIKCKFLQQGFGRVGH